MGLLLTLLLLLLGGVLGFFGQKIGERVNRIFGRLRRRERGFARHFRGLRSGGTDLIVITTTARPHLPPTDLLYFELIRHYLQNNLAQSVLINLWWPEAVAATAKLPSTNVLDGSQPYVAYLARLQADFAERVTVRQQIGSADPTFAGPAAGLALGVPSPGDAGLPDIFWRALKQLTSPVYYSWVRNLGIPARRLNHLTRARPGDQVLEGLVSHTIHNANLAPLVSSMLADIASKSTNDLVLSVIFWELEVDRLAVYYELYDEQKRVPTGSTAFALNPIAGRTIRSGRGRASDNHRPEYAISLAVRATEQLDRFAKRSRAEIRSYVDALATILSENYSLDVERRTWASSGRRLVTEWMVAERVRSHPRLNRSSYEMIFLMEEVKRQCLARRKPVVKV